MLSHMGGLFSRQGEAWAWVAAVLPRRRELRAWHLISVQLALLVLYRAGCDLFAWLVSPEFGRYGIAVNGVPFSGTYWTSVAAFLLVGGIYAVFINRKLDALDASMGFLFLVSYVPTSTAWWVTNGSGEYFLFTTAFWMSALLLLTLMSRPHSADTHNRSRIDILGIIYALALLALAILLYKHFGMPTDLAFETAYDRREDFAKWRPSGPLAYLFSWSVYVFGSYLLLVPRSLVLKALAVLFILLIYSASGDKVYLLLLPMFVFIQTIVARRLAWAMAPALTLAIAAAILFSIAGEVWVPSIMQRLLILPADIAFHHVEHFHSPLAYAYSFLSRFFDYPYDATPGLIIGRIFYRVGDNATAVFTADMFVNLRWYGFVPLVLFFLGLRWVVIPGGHAVILTPLFIQLLDTPLPTALLTGGGGLMILGAVVAAWLARRERKQADPEKRTGSS